MANEDLFAYGDGGTATQSNMSGSYGASRDPGYWGGDAGSGHYDENYNWIVDKESGAMQDVNRYRQAGQAAADRSAYRGNYADFNNASEGFAYGQGRARGAMDLQQQAAEGRAPSAATIAGKAAIGQSLDAQVSAAASTRGGPLAQASAARESRGAAGAFRQNAIQTLMAGRANEMAQARNAYAGSTFQYGQNQMGQQGLQLGKTAQEIQAEQFQRQLNQQAQQFNENKAFDTKSQDLAAGFARSGQQFQASQSGRQEDRADRLADMQETTGYVNAGSNMGNTFKPNSTSDARAKLPVKREPGADGLEVSQEEEYDSDDWERLRDAQKSDIYRGDPYDDKSNAMLDDRQAQGGRAPAHWLSGVMEPDADATPQMAAYQGQNAGDDMRFAYSDAQAKQETFELEREAKAGRMPMAEAERRQKEALERGKAREAEGAAMKKDGGDPSDPKLDWDAIDSAAAKEPRRKSAERTFRRDSPADQKKVRRTFEDKASKDADAMMAGMQKSLGQGPSVKATPQEDGERLAYSDKNAKKEAFQAGVQTGVKAAHTMKPVTVEGAAPPPSWAKKVAPRKGPSPVEDEQFEFYKAHPEHRQSIENDTEWEQNRIRAAARAEVPANLYGDSPAPVRDPVQRKPDDQESRAMDAVYGGTSYSDERTKTDAAHALEGSSYTYKDEYLPPEQGAGEVNHGPMAQNLEKNPLTRTAVKKDNEGMRLVDMTKLTKVHSSLIDHLQDQIDELKGRA